MRFFLVTLLAFADAAAGLAQDTPAMKAITQAEEAIRKYPARPDGYSALAAAQARRARETADSSWYDKAEAAVRQSLQIAPNYFDARRAEATVLFGRREYAKARELAITLNKRTPDDLQTYGLLVDANAALGNYDEAEKACNWMLRLRPGNTPAVIHAAQLREIFGDVQGAVDLLRTAYGAIPGTETEERALVLTRMARLKLALGKTAEAETLLTEALALFPGYPDTLNQVAELRIVQSKYTEAVDLLAKSYQAAPLQRTQYRLAEVLLLAGKKEEARKQFDDFETKALATGGANLELIAYYLDQANQPAKALAIAKTEFSKRHDIYTLDAYARALQAAGNKDEAKTQLQAALAVGTQDPQIRAHAQALGL
ncbi:MAG: tetratricopeptide repeat protein [Bryobacteraceae bacterium]